MNHFLLFTGRKNIGRNTMEFVFSRPKNFDFKAGQNIDITLGSLVYPFSIVSSPNEKFIRIATRMRNSKFKNVLRKLPIGAKVKIHGPSGDFTLRKKIDMPIVMVAGGIGITPFMSMILHAGEKRLQHKITLLYFNHSNATAVYLDELKRLTEQNRNFILRAVIGRARIKAERKKIYYLCGPPGFVISARKILDSAGIEENHIKTEEFSGY